MEMFSQSVLAVSCSLSCLLTGVQYSYKLTVGCQLLGSCSTSLARVGLRVLSLAGLSLPSPLPQQQDTLGPASPFLEQEAEEEGDSAAPSTEDLIMQAVQDITSRRRANYYNIATGRGKVCRFCIYKTDYRLGEDVVATLDFTAATLACVQFRQVSFAKTQLKE